MSDRPTGALPHGRSSAVGVGRVPGKVGDSQDDFHAPILAGEVFSCESHTTGVKGNLKGS